MACTGIATAGRDLFKDHRRPAKAQASTAIFGRNQCTEPSLGGEFTHEFFGVRARLQAAPVLVAVLVAQAADLGSDDVQVFMIAIHTPCCSWRR